MKQWQRTLVSADLSMEQGISVLNDSAQRILLVVDEENRLLGTVTDGDIRRALLAHLPMSTHILDVMHNKPVVALESWSKSQFRQIMLKHGVLQLPVVNKNGIVIGLETTETISGFQKKDNIVFLMAGGFGTRLKPLTNHCPKPLLTVGNKPILEIILESFVAAGYYRFYISTHYRGEMIRDYFGDGEKWGVDIKYVEEKEPLGTAGALSLLPKEIVTEPVFVMNGDLLTQLNFNNLLEFHESHEGVATMCVREFEYQIPYGVIENNGHRITSVKEKPVQKFFINAGIYLLSPELVMGIPLNTPVDMPNLLQESIGKVGSVNMFPLHEYWLDIGRMEDFKRAQAEFFSL